MYINQLMLDSVKVGRVRDRELPIHGNPPPHTQDQAL